MGLWGDYHVGKPMIMWHAWQPTPWWHWRRWAGKRMRRWVWDDFNIGGIYDGQWEYATHEECARRYLEEQFEASDVHQSSLTIFN